MMKALNKDIKWRIDNKNIFICGCKLLRDLFLPKKYLMVVKKFSQGVSEDVLNKEEFKLFSDLNKLNMLAILNIRPLDKKNFQEAIKVLDKELGINRVRDVFFLERKFKEFPIFFRGIFLGEDLAGVIFGFPREDYLLISEIAIKSKFQKRGFGENLVKDFEKCAKKEGYHKINVGSEDKVLNFYSKLGYEPFLLIQFEKEKYNVKDFSMKVIREGNFGGKYFIEVKVKDFSKFILDLLRKMFPLAHFQYIFTKNL